MWKKNEESNKSHSMQSTVETKPMKTAQPAAPSAATNSRAIIGQTIHINGEISGDEDLLVQGTVEGKIMLSKYNVSVGRNGTIKGDIHASQADIDGKVTGTITSDDVIKIRPSGVVYGDIVAPRVILEDGCKFKGTIDMTDSNASKAPKSNNSTASTNTAPKQLETKQSTSYDSEAAKSNAVKS